MSKMIPFPGTFQGEQDELTAMVPAAQLALSAIAGPLRGNRFAFDGGPFVIGRATDCRVAIPSQGVSRHHARIEYGNGGYWLIPEKTVNGSRLNGELVHEPTQLSDGDRLTINDSTFVIECRDPMRDALLDADLGELAPPPGPAMPAAVEMPPVRPSFAGRPTLQEMPRPATPAPTPAPPTRRWLWPAIAGVALIVIVAGVVAVTVRLVQPAPAPPPPASSPIVLMTPVPAPVAPAPAAAPPAKPPPAPAAKLVGTLTVETVQVVAGERGTIVDVARVGTHVARGTAVAHQRVYSAAFDKARARLAYLQKQYGSSPEHADFIEQAREEYVAARNGRKVQPIVSPIAGTVAKVAVKPGHDDHENTVVAELAVARLTVPVAAVDSAGKKCTAELVGTGEQLSGELLPVGSSERTLELDRLPAHASPGEVGEVRIHCSGD